MTYPVLYWILIKSILYERWSHYWIKDSNIIGSFSIRFSHFHTNQTDHCCRDPSLVPIYSNRPQGHVYWLWGNLREPQFRNHRKRDNRRRFEPSKKLNTNSKRNTQNTKSDIYKRVYMRDHNKLLNDFHDDSRVRFNRLSDPTNIAYIHSS